MSVLEGKVQLVFWRDCHTLSEHYACLNAIHGSFLELPMHYTRLKSITIAVEDGK